jgi:hypothetical protein
MHRHHVAYLDHQFLNSDLERQMLMLLLLLQEQQAAGAE